MPEKTELTIGDQQVQVPVSLSIDEVRRQFVAAADWARIPLLATDGSGKSTTNIQNIAEAVENGVPLTAEQVQQTKDAIKLLDSNEIVNARPILQQLKDTFSVLTTSDEQRQAQQPAATVLAASLGLETAQPSVGQTPQVIAPTQPKPATSETKASTVDEERDNFIRNALPVADALRKSGKPEEAKQLEQVAQAILQTKAMQLTPTQAVPAASKEESLKDMLANVFKAIDQDPTLKRMPEVSNLRRASNALAKEGMLNITVRNGVVVSFVSNFTDNFSRTQQLAAPELKPTVTQAMPLPSAMAQPAPVEAKAADLQPRVATVLVTSASNAEPGKGMREVLSNRFREAGATVEVVATAPTPKHPNNSTSELKVSYRLDQPTINKVSALLDAAAIMPSSKLREQPGDQAARKEAAQQQDENMAKQARQQQAAQSQPQAQADAKGKVQQPVEQPAPVFQAYPAYTSFGPSTETGVIESRKAVGQASPQLNVAISDKGEFGINPSVNQQRLIGDGLSSLSKFFDYALPSSGHKIAHVGLAEPGHMQQTEKGWEVITKGKLAITDTEGNVFKPQVGAAQVIAPTPTETVATQTPVVAPTPTAAPATGQRFSMSDIPVELLAKVGVPVDELERTGQLQKLLAGKKTDLIPGLQLPGPDGQPTSFAAKLVLDRDAQGIATLRVDLPKRELEIPQQLLGKEITPAMQEQLKTTGLVPLLGGFRDGKGQPFAAYLAVDKEMKRVVAVRPEGITLPQEVYGVKLSPEQQKSLLEGRPARIEGMAQPGAKQLVDALVQLDPLARKLIFRDTRPRVVPEQSQTQAQQPTRRQGARL